MWDLLLKNFSKHITLSPADEEVVRTVFQPKKFRRHQYILQQGDTCRHETFVTRGLTRTYEVDDKGVEHVLQFGPEDWWVGDLYSFLADKPSAYNIDCLEDTEVLQIGKAGLDTLYKEVPQMNQYFRILLQNAYIAATRRVLSGLSKPALERYQDFLAQYPHIRQRVPDHQIASYLGITPQSLSRVRRQYAG